MAIFMESIVSIALEREIRECKGPYHNASLDSTSEARSIHSMRAMVLEQVRTPLRALDIPQPKPASGEVLIQVTACAVCRTDLHVLDGELPNPKLPLVPGHEIVGKVI